MHYEKLLSQLVEIKSYSGEETELKGFIKNWFEQNGISAFEQDENLLVHLEGKDTTRAFIFNSHMDTVSAGDEDDWEHGPWNPTIVDGKLIGLGSSDMKAGLATTMLLAKQMVGQGKPDVDMWFTYVVKEEVDGSGSSSFAKWFIGEGYLEKYTDMAGIFTEPTNLTEIEHGHRGNIFLKVETRGDSGHASRPHQLKTHSVKHMFDFSNLLQHTMLKWQKEFPSDIFTPPTVGVMTSIAAGDPSSPNKFPANCVATFDVRTTPEFHPVAFEKTVALGNDFGAKVELAFPAAPAGYTDPTEKIVQVALQVLGNPKLTVSQGSADLGFLTVHGVKAIILGPGEKEVIHKVDEYCYPKQIPQAVEIYSAIVESWSK